MLRYQRRGPSQILALAAVLSVGGSVAARYSVWQYPIAVVALIGLFASSSVCFAGRRQTRPWLEFLPPVVVIGSMLVTAVASITVPIALTVPVAYVAGLIIWRGRSGWAAVAHFIDERIGDFSWRVLVLSLAYGLASAGVLFWYEGRTTSGKPVLPAGGVALVVVVLLFSVLNAFAEELVWRECLPLILRSTGVPWPLALAVSSVSFGMAHYYGIPSGVVGCSIAGVFGLGQSILVAYSGGIGAAIVAHVTVDLVVAYLILS